MKFPYEDIVNLEHFHAPNRPNMPISERAAQFMPFKSLNEYEDYVNRESDEINTAEETNYTIVYD